MIKLNPLRVRNLKEPGRYSDGDRLILEVRLRGSKTGIARLQANGRQVREIPTFKAAAIAYHGEWKRHRRKRNLPPI